MNGFHRALSAYIFKKPLANAIGFFYLVSVITLRAINDYFARLKFVFNTRI